MCGEMDPQLGQLRVPLYSGVVFYLKTGTFISLTEGP
jgi:hypothetical protein